MAGPMIWSLGLMSGTSLDGVDAALLLTDGERIEAFGPTLFRPYTQAERALLQQALAEAPSLSDRRARPGAVGEAERTVTGAHEEVVANLIAAGRRVGIAPEVIGFHGQTIFHAPERRLTVQIGDAGRLAKAAGLPVVYDFRADDVAAGGQGAPLVPVFHQALARRAGLGIKARTAVAFLNIGGVANLTVIAGSAILGAFDTGPGNALMDDAVRAATGQAFDAEGSIAARGRVDERILEHLMDHPYFRKAFPKSLDRNGFSRALVADLSLEDQLATLSAFTAEAVAAGLRLTGVAVDILIPSGGGARNRLLMAMLASRTRARLVRADELALDADFVEAQAFAYLAVRRRAGLPATYAETTGVSEPTPAGVLLAP